MPGRRFVAIAISLLLASTTLAAQTPPVCVVLQTANARLNTIDAAIGSTIYDGDRLETNSKGMLSVRSGQIQLTLSENSTLWMNHESSIVTPVLQRGTVTFRAETGSGIEVHADDVRVRPHNPVLTAGEITLDDCYVYVTARTQQLEVTAGKETRILEEGKAYRVARLGACGSAHGNAPRPPADGRFWVAPAAAVGGITLWVVLEALESPDRP